MDGTLAQKHERGFCGCLKIKNQHVFTADQKAKNGP